MIEISILCNDKAKEGFYSEHGFSVLIKRENYKLIFDTGTTDIFIKNLNKLNEDINNISDFVISHGHYDHLGGVRELSKFNKNFNVYVREEIFIPKYSKESYVWRYKEKFKNNLNFKFIKNDIYEIFPNIFIFGPSPMENNFELNDYFNEEISLAIDEEGLIIITGCAHRGIVNIVNHAINIFKKNIKIVMGGFHLYNASKEKLENIVKFFNSINIKILIPCHCTGDRAVLFFKNKFNGELKECLAGDILIFY